MHCSNLSLVNFRNYVRLDLELSPDVTVIIGNNAQGKSNLLEAIYYLATTKSFRANSDRELLNWLTSSDEIPFARLVAGIKRRHDALRLEIVIHEEQRRDAGLNGTAPGPIGKRIKVNGVAKRAMDLVGLVNVVMFSPEDIALIQGTPQIRRRYLDITISQVDPRYCRTLSHYNKVLLQRNHLLRQIRDQHSRPDQLTFWDEEIVNAGAYIMLRRLETVGTLNELSRSVHHQLTDGNERLQIGCLLNLDQIKGGVEISQMISQEPSYTPQERKLKRIAEAFSERLKAYQAREILYGMSLLGPHRDDLTFKVDGRDMNLFGSRGQQRTIVLSLKLAETQFMRAQTEEEPVLLLDDVLSELDPTRRAYVLDTVAGGRQVIITSSATESLSADFLRRANVLRVENGRISGVV